MTSYKQLEQKEKSLGNIDDTVLIIQFVSVLSFLVDEELLNQYP